MSRQVNEGAGVSANASKDWVVFTGKLPQALRKKLKLISVETDRKQQDIVAEALETWIAQQGF